METFNAGGRSRPPGGSAPSNPYQAGIALSLDEACDASGLSTAELTELLDDAIDLAIPASELEAWRRGDREFPAWVIPAISDVAGLEQRRGRWVRRQRGLARAKIPVALGVAGMVVAGLAWAMLSTGPAPAAASLAGADSRPPAPAATAPPSTPTPTAAPATLHRIAPQPAATSAPAHSPTPPALVAGAVAPTGRASPAVTAGGRQAATIPPSSSPTPSPSPTPSAPAPAPSGLVGGLLGGLLGLLGL